MPAAFIFGTYWENGIPTIRAAPNDEFLPCATKTTSETQSAIDLAISKTFKQYSIPLHITDNIRSTFKWKLWRMGKLYPMIERNAQLDSWKSGKCAALKMEINEIKVKTPLLWKRRVTAFTEQKIS